MNWQILEQFGVKAGLSKMDIQNLFKGEGFERLVMAGGGVPRDVLSLFLEVLSNLDVANGEKIGKDDVWILSRELGAKIEELKQDSKGDEQTICSRAFTLLGNSVLKKGPICL